MSDLDGKRVAVLVESEYIPEEIAAYQRVFPERGATVDLVSRLWGNSEVTFVSDVDKLGKALETLTVNIDLDSVNVEDYDAVIMCANYVSVRLRYFVPPDNSSTDWAELVRSAPAVQFFARAMATPTIVKGALCHGLWIVTPNPDLLKGRRVTCHRVVLADILNAGAVYDPAPVVTDADLVTGDSGANVLPFIDAICEKLVSE
ncbi:MAG: protease [Acidimicrobiaceae bacterium]|jgi:protease I|nr:protease [Acidimicrobiaceae bacterium]MDQ1399254.1 protease [Acidimicrobiaceae bacterium]MDQ1416761.1 protease [Acidimicrobiaceae bacterium]MDQ1418224.1 protease [Acidimicrobiaceae bacterium]MDQ1443005.1 protease [Acidimicrobiaceae bacterium]